MNGTPGIFIVMLSSARVVGCLVPAVLAFIAISIANGRASRRRRRRVELWSDDATRMQALLESGASPAVAEQLVQGSKINAIKARRDEMGLGLTEATQLVDRYESALYRYEPWDTRQAR